MKTLSGKEEPLKKAIVVWDTGNFSEYKMFYYRGLREFEKTPGYLMDTCLSAQDKYKGLLEYFS